MQVIEGHLAPFFARIKGGETISAPVVVSRVLDVWCTAIVVPLQEAALPQALLSQFLRDPLARGEGLVLVYGGNWTDAAADRLLTLATFYGVSPTLLRLTSTVTAANALIATASAVDAKHLLLLDPGAVGCAPGWRSILRNALESVGGTACVSHRGVRG